jgi:glycosyltransferase involved in cell wall biosynthesis
VWRAVPHGLAAKHEIDSLGRKPLLKVLHVIQDLSAHTGGPPVVITEASLALSSAGVEATVVATDAALMASAASAQRVRDGDLPQGARQLDIRLCSLQPPRRFAFSWPLARLLDRIAPEYDVVHIHMLYLFPHLAAYRTARKHRIPYVVSPHSALDPYIRSHGRLKKAIAWRLWQGAEMEHASALHLFAAEEVPLVSDIAPSVPRVIVPNGVRWSDYQDLPDGAIFRDRYLNGYGGPVVMFLGRIAEKKRIDILIEAFGTVAGEGVDARLVIAGPDNEGAGPKLRELVRQRDLSDHTFFPGMLHGEDKLAALAAADIWVLTSRSEGFSMAVIEALAAGRPCLLSPAVFIASEAHREGAALLCDLDSDAFATGIRELLANPDRRIKMGATARKFARRYDWDVVAQGWKRMYQQAISGAPAKSN